MNWCGSTWNAVSAWREPRERESPVRESPVREPGLRQTRGRGSVAGLQRRSPGTMAFRGKMLRQKCLAAFENEVAKRLRGRRQGLCLVVHHMPAPHDGETFCVGRRNQAVIEFQPQGV